LLFAEKFDCWKTCPTSILKSAELAKIPEIKIEFGVIDSENGRD